MRRGLGGGELGWKLGCDCLEWEWAISLWSGNGAINFGVKMGVRVGFSVCSGSGFSVLNWSVTSVLANIFSPKDTPWMPGQPFHFVLTMIRTVGACITSTSDTMTSMKSNR